MLKDDDHLGHTYTVPYNQSSSALQFDININCADTVLKLGPNEIQRQIGSS